MLAQDRIGALLDHEPADFLKLRAGVGIVFLASVQEDNQVIDAIPVHPHMPDEIDRTQGIRAGCLRRSDSEFVLGQG
mgnify:CR=1 FL=1